ncbi:hypothetical protein BFW89_09790 [Pseudomonas synxantha]|nr:hypothetical protein BFW89_09790 [Pseudomonas synxantha]
MIRIDSIRLATEPMDEHEKYAFYKGAAYNAMKMFSSAIQELANNKGIEFDNRLRRYEIINLDDMKSRPIYLFSLIKLEIG